MSTDFVDYDKTDMTMAQRSTTHTSNDSNEGDVLMNQLGQTLTRLTVATAVPGLQQFASWIRNGSVKRILVVTGAGVSVKAGLPDFRSQDTGLYNVSQTYDLPYPEAIFDLEYYSYRPQVFCGLAKQLWPGQHHKPTYTHCFLTLLARHNKLQRVYTQNIDGLDRLAGVPPEKLVECHGHFSSASCISIDCRKDANVEDVRKAMMDFQGMDGTIVNGKVQGVPTCRYCGSYVKPDVVFHGENLPFQYHVNWRRDVRQADCCLVMGSSLETYPVGGLPSLVMGPKLCFNREEINGVFDIFVRGDCDNTILSLASMLGWRQELEDLYAQVHQKHK